MKFIKKILLWVCIVFAGLVVLGALFGSSNEQEREPTIGTTTIAQSNAITTATTTTVTKKATTTTALTTTKATTAIVTQTATTTTLTKATTVTTTKTTQDATQEVMVWIPTKGGKRYHCKSDCSGMEEPQYVTLSEAKNLGFTQCGRCY